MLVVYVPDMPEPRVTEPDTFALQGRLDAAATVVTTDDNVFDLEDIDGKLQHRQTVEVGVSDDVSNVAVNEQLTGAKVEYPTRRNSRVGAAYPQVFGRLLTDQTAKKVRVLSNGLFRPGAVFLEEMGKFSHALSLPQSGSGFSLETLGNTLKRFTLFSLIPYKRQNSPNDKPNRADDNGKPNDDD